MKARLNKKDYEDAAKLLGISVAHIKAVAAVESSQIGGFIKETQEPTILFERHIFSRLTKGIYDAKYADISNRSAGGYGAYKVQHTRLQKAVKLDREAALQSASWGLFQIMGFNYKQAGFDDLQSFINAMYQSERQHLLAFCNFLIANDLVKYLKKDDFRLFARHYNGPAFEKNRYDLRMKEYYEKFKKEGF